MSKAIIDNFSPVYRTILPAFFERKIPLESAATCNKCVMLEQPSSSYCGERSFSHGSKCCTHHPELPNYLVGALLSNPDPAFAEGTRRISEKIRSKIGISPSGIMRPGKYSLLIKNSSPDFFGRSETLICPFYEVEKGSCSVAPYWDSVCATWFCKYVSGEDGRNFWLALRKYLEGVEHVLKRYPFLVMKLDFSSYESAADKQKPLTVQDLDDLPPLQKDYDALWGDWSGREEEFYLEAYRVVSLLDREKFENIEGIIQKGVLRDVENKYATLVNEPIPDRLQRNRELRVTKLSGDYYLLAAYSSFDPLKVSVRLYTCLNYFDGTRSNEEVLKSIQETMSVTLTGKMLEKLYRFRILSAAAE